MNIVNPKTRMFRIMGVMMNRGVPLFEIFNIITREIQEPGIQEAIAGIKEDISTGGEMSPAARKFPDVFSPVACELIKGGERGGHLEQVFMDLGEPGKPPLSDCGPENFPVFKAFGVCLRSGVPVLKALEVIALETQGTEWEPAFKAIAEEIKQGGNLAPAVSKYPQQFPAPVQVLIEAGEVNGFLDLQLNFLGKLQDKGIPLMPDENPRTEDAVRRFAYLFGNLLEFGVTVKHTLAALIDTETHPRMRAFMEEFLAKLDDHTMAYDIMPNYPDLFTPSFVSLVEWAEKAGNIPGNLEAIQEGMEVGLFLPDTEMH